MWRAIACVGCWLLLTCVALAQAEPAAEGEHLHNDLEAEHGAEMMPPLGSLCFLELPAVDPAAAGEFYGLLFDWEISSDDESGMVFFSDPHGAVGVFSQAEELSAAGSYVFYIAVENVSAKLEEIDAAGGSVVSEEQALPEDWGFVGLFGDPSGNVVGLWSPHGPEA